MVQDEVVEHGLVHMFRSWQELTTAELASQSVGSPVPAVPQVMSDLVQCADVCGEQDWIDGITKINLGWIKSSKSQHEDEEKLRAAAQQ